MPAAWRRVAAIVVLSAGSIAGARRRADWERKMRGAGRASRWPIRWGLKVMMADRMTGVIKGDPGGKERSHLFVRKRESITKLGDRRRH
jgi:hypothetical protein